MQEVRLRCGCGSEGGKVGQGQAAYGTDSLKKGWVQEEAKAANEAGTRMYAREE